MNNKLTNNETVFITVGGEVKTLHSIELTNQVVTLHVYDMETVSGTSAMSPESVVLVLDRKSKEFNTMFKESFKTIREELEDGDIVNGQQIVDYLVHLINENELMVNTLKDDNDNLDDQLGAYLESVSTRNDNVGLLAKYLYDKYHFQRVLRHPYTQAWIDSGIRYSNTVTELKPEECLAY